MRKSCVTVLFVQTILSGYDRMDIDGFSVATSITLRVFGAGQNMSYEVNRKLFPRFFVRI